MCVGVGGVVCGVRERLECGVGIRLGMRWVGMRDLGVLVDAHFKVVVSLEIRVKVPVVRDVANKKV